MKNTILSSSLLFLLIGCKSKEAAAPAQPASPTTQAPAVANAEPAQPAAARAAVAPTAKAQAPTADSCYDSCLKTGPDDSPMTKQDWPTKSAADKEGECSAACSEGPPVDQEDWAALPGKCVPIPAHSDSITDLDIDGDNHSDVLVPPADDECNKYDCLYTVYARRGDCGHKLGAINVGLDRDVTLTGATTHGIADLKSVVRDSTLSYIYDGKKYVADKTKQVAKKK